MVDDRWWMVEILSLQDVCQLLIKRLVLGTTDKSCNIPTVKSIKSMPYFHSTLSNKLIFVIFGMGNNDATSKQLKIHNGS